MESAVNAPMTTKCANLDASGFHTPGPDYTRPRLRVPAETRTYLLDALTELYGRTLARRTYRELERLMQVYYAHKTQAMLDWEAALSPSGRFTEKDAVLITYGDLVQEAGRLPLDCLAELVTRYLKDVFNTLHILPFFPYSSDRGFSVIDFKAVDRKLGTWDNIVDLKQHFRLMFDGVFNHVSSQSPWFQEFLNGNPEYRDFFTSFSRRDAVSEELVRRILRPRTSDLLSEYQTLRGSRRVWTTFSPDQVDLRFQNPKVLAKIVEILLLYVRKGADLIRLDAVTYLWDELGTSGSHLRQTHLIIQLMRRILDAVAPHVALVTETNVPHADNISYFGDGSNEAQMVYNFALPPLLLHTFQTGNTARLTAWAAGLERISPTATYFNFFDSHDGIGVMGARGILGDGEIAAMCARVVEHGGHISYKSNSDGSRSPYELNITSYSALNRDDRGEDEDLQVRRYLAARSLPLVLMGVPGVYLHGLLGSPNDVAAVRAGQENRSINRKNLDKAELFQRLENPVSVTARIVRGFVRMIMVRSQQAAFHPNAGQRVYNCSEALVMIGRVAPDGGSFILTVTNVTGAPQRLRLDEGVIGRRVPRWEELLSKRRHEASVGVLEATVPPYGVWWLRALD